MDGLQALYCTMANAQIYCLHSGSVRANKQKQKKKQEKQKQQQKVVENADVERRKMKSEPQRPAFPAQ